MINIYNMDCMELLKQTPDKYYELSIVDPPFGIGASSGQSGKGRHTHLKKEWDNNRPDKSYFNELFRVSVNQIIWGANYFTKFLPPSMGWIFWDKDNHKFTLSDGELAYTSFNKKLTVFKRFANLDRGFMADALPIHPTMKPIPLYLWLLENYAKQGDKILDTHLGSMSSVIASIDLGFDITGCELDKDYFLSGKARVEKHLSQLQIFQEMPEIVFKEQLSLLEI